ncbi:MAG: hypothetical protein EOO80_17245, partial [Oxalobacteraceae bacterium]
MTLTEYQRHEKAVANMRARFALLGHELHVVHRAGATHYDARRQGQSRVCSTLHDLQGFLDALPLMV